MERVTQMLVYPVQRLIFKENGYLLLAIMNFIAQIWLLREENRDFVVNVNLK